MARTLQDNKAKTNAKSLMEAREESIKKNKEELLSLEIKKTEALRSQFLSNVSHELKTPLNSILAASTLLRNRLYDTESLELLGIIRQSSQQLNITLNNVLDYYKLLSNLLTLDNLRFNLFSMLKELYSLFSSEAREKGLDLVFEISEGLPEFVTGDETRLKQILSNLLENAIKFTEKGHVKLEAGVDSVHENFKKLYFRVSDSGAGMGGSDIENLWRSFSVGSKSYSREHQGIGMGLVLSKKLCELMGGDIFVKETSSNGTTFEFHVILKSGDSNEHKEPKGKLRRILLVEDNLVNRKLTRNLLSNSGYEVDVAENGWVAIAKFKQRAYDMILMDIQMPVMDGITACKEIRSIEPRQGNESRVKIFAFTANAQKQDKDECMAAGMDGYMSKPLNPKEIKTIFSNL